MNKHPWTAMGKSIVDFRVGITADSLWVHPMPVATPWIEMTIAVLLLFPLCWVLLATGVIRMAFLGLGVTAAWRQMQVACGCWGGTMLVGPLCSGSTGNVPDGAGGRQLACQAAPGPGQDSGRLGTGYDRQRTLLR